MPEVNNYRSEKERLARRNPYVPPNAFIIFDPELHDSLRSFAGPCAITNVSNNKPGQFGLIHLKDASQGEKLFNGFWKEWEKRRFEIRDMAGLLLGATRFGTAKEFGERNFKETKSNLERRGILCVPVPVAVGGHRKCRTIKVEPDHNSAPLLFFKEGDLDGDLGKKDLLWQEVEMQKLIAERRAAARRIVVPKSPRVFIPPVSPRDFVPMVARGLPPQSRPGIFRSLFS